MQTLFFFVKKEKKSTMGQLVQHPPPTWTASLGFVSSCVKAVTLFPSSLSYYPNCILYEMFLANLTYQV